MCQVSLFGSWASLMLLFLINLLANIAMVLPKLAMVIFSELVCWKQLPPAAGSSKHKKQLATTGWKTLYSYRVERSSLVDLSLPAVMSLLQPRWHSDRLLSQVKSIYWASQSKMNPVCQVLQSTTSSHWEHGFLLTDTVHNQTNQFHTVFYNLSTLLEKQASLPVYLSSTSMFSI